MSDLKARLMEAIPELQESDFGFHASDLYVRGYPKVIQWLVRNYRFYRQITSFIGAEGSDWAGKLCLDIPFAGKTVEQVPWPPLGRSDLSNS